MTAAELHAALRGVPAEALCGTIRYNAAGWCDESSCSVPDDHAAALQRDAMTEWLYANDKSAWFRISRQGDEWAVMIDRTDTTPGGYAFVPTRLHALAAACRYVAEQKKVVRAAMRKPKP